ncbi:MAG: alpha/beta fold hydrolase [Anaerolineae bacterium]|nr:alpha/beta fold hydrolase [Anaerolineae bacterium]MDW8173230.1 alpha/beta fold hydrolase [Anaerolineae bacterium]
MPKLTDTARKLALFGLLGGMVAASTIVNRRVPLVPALAARRVDFLGKRSCFLSCYIADEALGVPLLLIHSINAAASAYEMKPLFEAYRRQRPVYALDLPGFGYSERTQREYSPELYAAAILDALDFIGQPCDVIALSLSSEFAARAALQSQAIRSLSFISPTGFAERNAQQSQDDDAIRLQIPPLGTLVEISRDEIYNVLANPILSRTLYNLLTTEPSIRYFLAQSFKGALNDGLAEYSWTTSHQEGARYAPLYFLSGKLFTRRAFDTLYKNLSLPVLVLYDRDPHTSFERLPDMLEKQPSWRARRIPNTLGLPHFERLDKVKQALDSFWADLS